MGMVTEIGRAHVCRPARSSDLATLALSQVLEILLGNAELSQDLEEQRRADLPTAVNGNGHGASVRMVPTLVAAGLPRAGKPELAGCILEVAGRTARHVRFRWCRQAKECVFPNTLPRSSEKRWPTRSMPLRASALGRSTPGWREFLQPRSEEHTSEL